MYYNRYGLVISTQADHQIRQQIVVPDPHGIQNGYGDGCGLQDRHYDTEEGLQRVASVDHGCLFDVQWNRFDESTEHEHGQAGTKSQIQQHHSGRVVQVGHISQLGHSEHYHLERHDHGKYEHVIQHIGHAGFHSGQIVRSHGSEQNDRCHGKYSDKC